MPKAARRRIKIQQRALLKFARSAQNHYLIEIVEDASSCLQHRDGITPDIAGYLKCIFGMARQGEGPDAPISH